MKKCITTIYYLVDNFCKIYNEWEKEKLNVAKNRWNTYETEIKKEELVIIETNIVDYFLLD